jgi:hypothetical protein
MPLVSATDARTIDYCEHEERDIGKRRRHIIPERVRRIIGALCQLEQTGPRRLSSSAELANGPDAPSKVAGKSLMERSSGGRLKEHPADRRILGV